MILLYAGAFCFALAVFMAACAVGVGGMLGLRRCSQSTRGTVADASAVNYKDHHIALVEYEVAGEVFEVAGPRFWRASVKGETPSNVMAGEPLPAVLRGPALSNDELLYESTHAGPARQRLYQEGVVGRAFPLGSQVTVWYEPANPGNAYVERPVWQNRSVVLGFAVLSLLCVVAGIGLFVTMYGRL